MVVRNILIVSLSFLFYNFLSAQDDRRPISREDVIQNIKIEQTSAQFPGGKEEMNRFIYDNLKYPEEAKKNRITGNVGLTFVVDTEGKISEVRVIQSQHKALDEEAIRIVESMPDWEPAKRNNIPVRSTPMIFITFRL